MVLELVNYKYVITEAVSKMAPNKVCQYLYNIVCTFTKFYAINKCIYDDTFNHSRICLVYYTKQIIVQLFYLIGLDVVNEL